SLSTTSAPRPTTQENPPTSQAPAQGIRPSHNDEGSRNVQKDVDSLEIPRSARSSSDGISLEHWKWIMMRTGGPWRVGDTPMQLWACTFVSTETPSAARDDQLNAGGFFFREDGRGLGWAKEIKTLPLLMT
ncbi:hypothetical protein PSTT_10465, partial [Puccinia striiformis]